MLDFVQSVSHELAGWFAEPRNLMLTVGFWGVGLMWCAGMILSGGHEQKHD